jgi:hypothetical protein
LSRLIVTTIRPLFSCFSSAIKPDVLVPEFLQTSVPVFFATCSKPCAEASFAIILFGKYSLNRVVVEKGQAYAPEIQMTG